MRFAKQKPHSLGPVGSRSGVLPGRADGCCALEQLVGGCLVELVDQVVQVVFGSHSRKAPSGIITRLDIVRELGP